VLEAARGAGPRGSVERRTKYLHLGTPPVRYGCRRRDSTGRPGTVFRIRACWETTQLTGKRLHRSHIFTNYSSCSYFLHPGRFHFAFSILVSRVPMSGLFAPSNSSAITITPDTSPTTGVRASSRTVRTRGGAWSTLSTCSACTRHASHIGSCANQSCPTRWRDDIPEETPREEDNAANDSDPAILPLTLGMSPRP
jgi:hypothetical protein